MRHRLRIAAALDKIILMIFDERIVGRWHGGGVGRRSGETFGRLLAWVPTPEQLHKTATSRPKKPRAPPLPIFQTRRNYVGTAITGGYRSISLILGRILSDQRIAGGSS